MAYAGAAVVNARQLRMFPEIKYDVDDVFDVDKIANLAAVLIARRTGKQGDFARFLQFVVFLENEGRHAVLVIFLRPKDVEVPEAYDLALRQGHDAADEAVELQLGIGVGIESLLALRFFAEAVLAAAVGRRRRCIQEGNLALHAVAQQVLAAFVIVLHHVAAVVIHRIGAGSFMEYDVDIAAVKGIVGHLHVEIFIVHVIVERKALQIAAFASVRQVVDDEDIVDSPVIQLFYYIAADKSGAACYDFHSLPSFAREAIFCTNPVVEYPSSKDMISTRFTYSLPTTSSAL